jgi:predicted peptidase
MARFTRTDRFLLAAIAALSIVLLAMLLEPAFVAWCNRPRPGMQVDQRYVGQKTATDYLLYLPQKYDSSRRWPLVLYLHGSGHRGQDLTLVRRSGLPGQICTGRHFPFILLSPQCPADSQWIPEVVVELVEHVSKSLSVDRDRVYLTGYSMGGFGTWETAAFDPGRFAAIAPLCGGGDVSRAERLKMPIWAFHGEKDDVVPLRVSREMVDAVRKCGGRVKFTVHPGIGHGICGQTYQDGRLFDWLLAQRRSGSP